MRILVVNQYFPPDRSATAQLLGELCEDLSRRHQVFVVAGRPSYNPGAGVTDHPRIQIRRAWSTTFNRARMAGRLSNYGTFLLSSVMNAMTGFRPDVVLAWTDPPIIGLVASAAARRHRVPFVLGAQDIFPDVAIQLGRLRNPAAVAVFRKAAQTLFKSATRVVSLGRDMDRRLRDLGVPAHRIRTVSNWADGNRIQPLPPSSKLRSNWGFGDRFVVMHAGNVGLSQDLDNLVTAAEILRPHSEVVLAITGEGVSRARLVSEVERRRLPNVAFLEYQPQAALSEMLSAADCHLVSLKAGLEGFIVPSKTYSILAAARPYIAAVAPDAEPALIAREHGCGLQSDPGDARALADAVLQMQKEDRAAMGIRGRSALEKCFDRRVATDAYESVLGEVVAEAGSGSQRRG